MKTTRVYRTKATVTVKGGKRKRIFFKLPPDEKGYPEGYKFSWIAFDPDDPLKRVLFDVHPPKGPHLHIDEDPVGVPYEWKGLAEAEGFFTAKIQEHFGEFDEEDE